MQSIKQVQRLNDTELEKVVPSNASWHTDYRDTAYIYIGGLPFELSEGDILTIFSQYGNPVHINLVRDKETGKSRGYCFLKYEDQRSCDLAVDNLSGAGVMGRLLSVDHTRYKKKDGEVEGVGDVEEVADETDEEGQSRSKRRRTDSLSEVEQERPMIQEESELVKLRREMDDDDPMKAYMIKEKQVEVEEALKALAMSKHKGKDNGRDREHKHRHRYHRSEHEHADKEQGVERDGHKSRQDKAPDEQATMRQSRELRRNRSTTPEDSRDNDGHRRR
ncbi:RNA-binding protein Cwf29 [Friedmanniomyces endolithicus]|uniref:RNA-binding protein Cwf29 n=1 Tax=Friedmanniomyces endolithicus TaxID=329885 RepID=A0AAN6FZ40_9PEZI|nr:RNA-binding protein Cwf29 [Friedmanniomyces endolithicus]KAK0299602.1 RNA-binding protein Cwf29 [Friedmanniomyces endolithicus]KAK0327095.1 RNA-binding protein Cwf29 [Friedmanniomyces endolithicus]KAK1019070.1 RNA-binding protein Cwf29 [Friedmanniomyces endolithicus]